MCNLYNFLPSDVSIHAPTKGATIGLFGIAICQFLFQSTLPRRERLHDGADNERRLAVSIHAPTKGATRRCMRWRNLLRCFNPRSHEGSDYTHTVGCTNKSGFQSTLPRRERQSRCRLQSICSQFQSTLPRRERP